MVCTTSSTDMQMITSDDDDPVKYHPGYTVPVQPCVISDESTITYSVYPTNKAVNSESGKSGSRLSGLHEAIYEEEI